MRAHVLRDAEVAVTQNRNVEYGDAEDNFRNIADLWNAYFLGRFFISGRMAPHDVAILMILVKVARLIQTPTSRDSWVDIAGYAACGAQVAQAGVECQEDKGEHA